MPRVPEKKWVPDISYLMTSGGWLYLTVIIDLFDRKIIGWSMAEELAVQGVCRALAMAVGSRPFREGLIFHSDRGVQYCSDEFCNELNRLCPSARRSMSRKGNCWDNAYAESFFKTLKTELDLSEKRRYSAKQVKSLVFEYFVALTNNFVA
jgi:transposase InsO family protein